MLSEREEKIVSYIEKNKRVSVKKLAETFFVCEMTIRRDLKELEAKGYVKRYNGGAVYAKDEIIPIESRKYFNADKKKKLSAEVKIFLKDSITVFIDSSSTCMYIMPLLAEYKNITVITNSVNNLIAASEYHIPVILAGGNYYETDMCTVGSITENFLKNINVDIGFFSALGISDSGLITDNDQNQTAIRKIMIENSEKKFFMFDSTKEHKKYTYTLCRAEDADHIFTI